MIQSAPRRSTLPSSSSFSCGGPRSAVRSERRPLQPCRHWATDLDDLMERPVVGLAVGADAMKGTAYAGALYMCGLRVKLIDASRWAGPKGLVSSPVTAALAALEGLDGILFTGGGDLDPALQGLPAGDPTIGGVLPARDHFEVEACRLAIDEGIPVLGICRGMQLINFTQGGTLYQDIDRDCAPLQTPKGHRQIDRGLAKSEVGHDIEMTPASRVAEMFGSARLGVNSDHHQAVHNVGRDLVVTARADDGTVEAIESSDPNRFVVGVQFHPELMYARDPAFLAPFAAFAEAVRARSKGRT